MRYSIQLVGFVMVLQGISGAIDHLALALLGLVVMAPPTDHSRPEARDASPRPAAG